MVRLYQNPCFLVPSYISVLVLYCFCFRQSRAYLYERFVIDLRPSVSLSIYHPWCWDQDDEYDDAIDSHDDLGDEYDDANHMLV